MIQTFADWLVYTVFGMSPESHWGSAVNFFFYDTIKITVLLFFISVIMGVINAYFPIDRLRRYLTSRNFYVWADKRNVQKGLMVDERR